MSALPGVRVGPLDPDATEQFGHVAAHTKAKTLLRIHAQQHPVELTRELARPLDEPRTRALDRDEVVKYLSKCKLSNGDPVLPEDAQFESAAVRGKPDTKQVLTFQYLVHPSGRVAKWFVAYDRDALSKSAEAGDELAQVAEMRERGVVFGLTGAEAEIQRRTAARLAGENEQLRARIEGRTKDMPDGVEADVRPEGAVVEEAQGLRRENAELRERLAQLEQSLGERSQKQMREDAEAAAERQRAQTGGRVEAQEPVEGYDDLKADDAKKLLRSEDVSPEQRERILEYERSHANRKSVVQAGESARS